MENIVQLAETPFYAFKTYSFKFKACLSLFSTVQNLVTVVCQVSFSQLLKARTFSLLLFLNTMSSVHVVDLII